MREPNAPQNEFDWIQENNKGVVLDEINLLLDSTLQISHGPINLSKQKLGPNLGKPKTIFADPPVRQLKLYYTSVSIYSSCNPFPTLGFF